uniref:hypothetical protein n=1 Tax=Vibrio owensii TaxID=696485 RepID=UPI0005B39E1B
MQKFRLSMISILLILLVVIFLSKYDYCIYVLRRLLLELIALEIRKVLPHMVGITYRLKISMQIKRD